MKPTVSVIIPCYNGAEYLAEAVDSVLAQTFTDLECLIVDDGSTDHTRQVGEKLAEKDPRVKYFYKDNAGVAAARNFGVERAQGNWIQFLDADDWLHQDKLNFQLSHLKRPNADDPIVFYSDYKVIFQDQEGNTLKTLTQISGELNNEQLLDRIVTWQFKPDFPAPIWSLLLDKRVFSRKLLNEEFGSFEDFEFIMDLLLKGIPFIYTPIVGVFYRKHASSLTKQSHHRDNYVLFLEAMYHKDKNLLLKNPNLRKFIREAFANKDRNKFNRLLKIVDTQQMPIQFFKARVRVKNKLLVRFFFWLNLFIPGRVTRLAGRIKSAL